MFDLRLSSFDENYYLFQFILTNKNKINEILCVYMI